MAEWQSARLESVSPDGVLGSNPSPGVILQVERLNGYFIPSLFDLIRGEAEAHEAVNSTLEVEYHEEVLVSHSHDLSQLLAMTVNRSCC